MTGSPLCDVRLRLWQAAIFPGKGRACKTESCITGDCSLDRTSSILTPFQPGVHQMASVPGTAEPYRRHLPYSLTNGSAAGVTGETQTASQFSTRSGHQLSLTPEWGGRGEHPSTQARQGKRARIMAVIAQTSRPRERQPRSEPLPAGSGESSPAFSSGVCCGPCSRSSSYRP